MELPSRLLPAVLVLPTLEQLYGQALQVGALLTLLVSMGLESRPLPRVAVAGLRVLPQPVRPQRQGSPLWLDDQGTPERLRAAGR
jgi:hypothetical protein